jgi:carboxyl-terminal processing protease
MNLMEQEPTRPTINSIFSQPWLLGCTVVVVLLLTFASGIGTGYALARWGDAALAFTAGVADNGRANGRPASARTALAADFAIFWEALDKVYQDFYGQLPSTSEMTYDAIRGVVNGLGDHNTSFMTPQEAEMFRTAMQGSFDGIGARVEWDVEFDTLRITEPFENQPAWQAGLRRGDLVLKVDDVDIRGTNLNDAVGKIRGERGTKVRLLVARDNKIDEPFAVEVTRDRIETPTITTDTLGKARNIGYVRLYTFNQNAGQLVRQAFTEALKSDPQALIFDLRGNSGGLLSQAVEVANVFLPADETVLLERFSSGKTETYKTTEKPVEGDLPLVVLVNEGSASASEIVAGALQDLQRATLIGTTTYGKGSVQLPHTLSSGAIMRVTIAHWFTPNDRTIEGQGLEPDQVVAITEEQRTAGDDPQLEAAIKSLEKELQ